MDIIRRILRESVRKVLSEGITVQNIIDKHGSGGFVIVSADKNYEKKGRNANKTQQLISKIRKSGFAYLPVYGGMHDPNRMRDDNFEPSFIIFAHKTDGQPVSFAQIYELGLQLCKDFEQSSIYVSAPRQHPHYENAEGSVVSATDTNNITKQFDQRFFSAMANEEALDSLGENNTLRSGF